MKRSNWTDCLFFNQACFITHLVLLFRHVQYFLSIILFSVVLSLITIKTDSFTDSAYALKMSSTLLFEFHPNPISDVIHELPLITKHDLFIFIYFGGDFFNMINKTVRTFSTEIALIKATKS